MGIYYNKEYRKSFKKDNCPEDLGTTEEFVVEEGQFVSRISQADADRQAEEYAEKEGQKFANNFGGCCHVYYNRKVEGDFYSSKCTGDTRQKNPTHYTVEAGRFYSADSPADADKMAEKALAEEGQAAADNNGQCAPIYWNNRQHGWYTKVCPDHWESKPRYMSIDAGEVYSFVSVEDADRLAKEKLDEESQTWVEENEKCDPVRPCETEWEGIKNK